MFELHDKKKLFFFIYKIVNYIRLMFGIQDIFFKVDVGECQKNRRCRHWNLFKILIEEKERRERLWEDSLFVRLLTHIATSEVFFLNRSPFWWISDENLGNFNRILKVVNGKKKKATFPMIFSLMSRKNVSLVSWKKKSESFCSLLSKANREKKSRLPVSRGKSRAKKQVVFI